MKPMFLPDVEKNPQPGPWADAIRSMQQAGTEYPQIWHMFAFKPEATSHLARFTQEIMREALTTLVETFDEVSVSKSN